MATPLLLMLHPSAFGCSILFSFFFSLSFASAIPTHLFRTLIRTFPFGQTTSSALFILWFKPTAAQSKAKQSNEASNQSSSQTTKQPKQIMHTSTTQRGERGP
ncbi:MAG: hypothetical protein J3Q66DRAFT_360137 [Benniella sp.]|nr:MAG: hypothetical protein J3Q66DRAFT_360137 [Benniella sp.]